MYGSGQPNILTTYDVAHLAFDTFNYAQSQVPTNFTALQSSSSKIPSHTNTHINCHTTPTYKLSHKYTYKLSHNAHI